MQARRACLVFDEGLTAGVLLLDDGVVRIVNVSAMDTTEAPDLVDAVARISYVFGAIAIRVDDGPPPLAMRVLVTSCVAERRYLAAEQAE